MSDLRDVGAARDWLAAGLQLVRIGAVDVDGFPRSTACIQAASTESIRIPPVGFLLDLHRLFAGQELTPIPGPAAFAEVLRRYDDQVLGRLAVHPLRCAIGDALTSLPVPLRGGALGLLVEAMLGRMGFEQGVAVAPEALEELGRIDVDVWLTRGPPALRGLAGEALRTAYEQLIELFARAADPLVESEVLLVQRLEQLRGRADRLALVQLADVAGRLRAGLPRTVRAGRRHGGHVPTVLQEESSYPVGGFSSITNRGSMENLVPSELAGMEDGQEIDLFDVRYTEHELLFYTRDENAFTRSTRQVFIVLHPSLDRLRHRHAELPFQERILALGLAVGLVMQLEQWLSDQALFVHLVWPEQGLEEDAAIVRIALQTQEQAGWVEFVRGSAVDAMLHSGQRWPTDVVHLTANEGSIPTVEHTWTSVVEVAAVPSLLLPGGPMSLGDEPWAAWCQAFDLLVRDLC